MGRTSGFLKSSRGSRFGFGEETKSSGSSKVRSPFGLANIRPYFFKPYFDVWSFCREVKKLDFGSSKFGIFGFDQTERSVQNTVILFVG